MVFNGQNLPDSCESCSLNMLFVRPVRASRDVKQRGTPTGAAATMLVPQKSVAFSIPRSQPSKRRLGLGKGGLWRSVKRSIVKLTRKIHEKSLNHCLIKIFWQLKRCPDVLKHLNLQDLSLNNCKDAGRLEKVSLLSGPVGIEMPSTLIPSRWFKGLYQPKWLWFSFLFG